jgi:uncharacterized membrane protein (UPF0127 family)
VSSPNGASRRLIAVAIVLAVVAGVLLVVGVVLLRGSDDGPDAPAAGTGVAAALDDATEAVAPFVGLTEARLALGDRCLRVAIADEAAERHQGLRGVTDLGDYDGMLFIHESDTESLFTMAGTPLPLDIGWYTSDGAPVNRTTMQPCLEGNDASCPLYESRGKYRYALETEAGQGGGGAIGSCGS